MTLPLTPDSLAAAYEYLRTTPPFKRWKLPPADEVEFHVTRHRDREGDHTTYQRTNDHVIRVSSYHVKTTTDLLVCIAHELVHMRESQLGVRHRDHHTIVFRKLAQKVCTLHGWTMGSFI